MFAGKRESRLQDRWGVGLYLGLISRSSLYLVGTKEGVHRARTIKRMIITERADADLLNTFIGVPWMLQPGAIAMQPTIIYAEPEVEASELPPIPERAAARPRQVYLRKHVELKRHGYTAGCPGCEAAQGDMPAKPHTATCRARVEARMMEEGTQGQVRVTESLLKRSLDQGGTAVPMDTTTTPSVVAPQSGPASVSRPGAASSSSTTIVHARPEIEEPSARRARHLPPAGAEMDVAILGALEAEVQCYGLSSAEVAEIFGPGRFTSVSSAFDLRPGHAMDLRSGYDFNNAADRKRGELEFLDEQPLLLVGSPPCVAFSTMQNFAKDSQAWRAKLREGLQHLEFVCKLYKLQHASGRFFLHEHPKSAASWKLWMIQEVVRLPGVVVAECDQCAYGQWSVDAEGPALIKAPTKWMTNSCHIADALSLKCTGGHRHCVMFSNPGAWRVKERYPIKLVHAVLRALRREQIDRGMLGTIEVGTHVDEPDPWDCHPEYYQEVYDTTSGSLLDPELVAKGRREEMVFLHDLGAYEYDTIAQCRAETGRAPLPTGWVDVNKGDAVAPQVRCRWVVKETKWKTTMDVSNPALTFSAAPPYEALRFICSMVMSPSCKEEYGFVLLFIDITRAHPHAVMTRKVWVNLPLEDARASDPTLCGRLLRNMYGLRDAGQSFELFTFDVMTKLEFAAGVWTPCLFNHLSRNMQVYVYGDNFVGRGSRLDLKWLADSLSVHMWVKVEGVLGPDMSQGDVSEILCLNRIIRWVRETGSEPARIEIEADARHSEILISQAGLTSASKSLVAPGTSPKSADVGKALDGADATLFRSMCMRAMYLAEDRPEIKYAAKESARLMSTPCAEGLQWLKHLARYLLGRPRMVQKMVQQKLPTYADAVSDANHAGCLRTRKSTGCTLLFHGTHLIKALSTTQEPQALSSGESEWYSLVRSACAGIGFMNMAKDLGRDLQPRLWGDATAAAGIANRRGAGKIRHLETKTLWLQRLITEKKVVLKRRPGKENEADIGTKHLDRKTLDKFLQSMGYVDADGVSPLSLKASL